MKWVAGKRKWVWLEPPYTLCKYIWTLLIREEPVVEADDNEHGNDTVQVKQKDSVMELEHLL